MELTIRPVTAGDVETVNTLVGALFMELRGTDRPEPNLAGEGLLERVLERSFGFLLNEGDTPIGIIMISEGQALYAGGSFGVITELYVVPQKRSSGAAQRLVAQGQALGRDRGWTMLEVGAPPMPKWIRSRDFYIKEGFAEIGPRLRKRLSPGQRHA